MVENTMKRYTEAKTNMIILYSGLIASLLTVFMVPNFENKSFAHDGANGTSYRSELSVTGSNLNQNQITQEKGSLFNFEDGSGNILPELTHFQFISVYTVLFLVFMVQSTRLHVEVRMYQYFNTNERGEIEFQNQEALAAFELNSLLSKFFKVFGIGSGIIAVLAIF